MTHSRWNLGSRKQLWHKKQYEIYSHTVFLLFVKTIVFSVICLLRWKYGNWL